VVIPRLPHVARKISNLTTARNNAKPLSVAQRRHPVSQRANITQPCPSSTTSLTCSRCVPSFPHRENGALRSLPSKHVSDKRSAAASRRPFTPAPPPRPLCYLDCARVRAPCFLSSSGSRRARPPSPTHKHVVAISPLLSKSKCRKSLVQAVRGVATVVSSCFKSRLCICSSLQILE
jgi:hypothetical protein